MGKIAAMEDVEGIRDEQDIGDEPIQEEERDGIRPEDNGEMPHDPPHTKSGRYVSTLVEVQDAFEHLNTLRYCLRDLLEVSNYLHLIALELTYYLE